MNANYANAEALIAMYNGAVDESTRLNIFDEIRTSLLANVALVDVLASSNERWAKEAQAKKQAVEKFIDTYVEYGDEPNASVSDLAEAFDIEMTTEYSVSVTMTYNMTITAPRGTDSDTIEQSILWNGQPSFYADYDGFELSGGDDIAADFDITVD